jgi:formate dehydrogenase iron-sulfur subunit
VSDPKESVTRRDFLKAAGLSVAAAATGLVLPHGARIAEASEPTAGKPVGVLIDLTRCVGCESCALACKRVNSLPNPEVAPNELDANAYCFVDERRLAGVDGQSVTQFVKRQCMHCLHPACASACTVGALTKSANGPVVYDKTRCFGCRYCQYACPFGVPTYEWKNPIGLIHKCQLCADRLKQGLEPACTCSCPTGALRFGDREMLIAQAQAQIDYNKGRYVNHIYGENEVGGTSMLYISKVPFADLGFPVLGSDPIPKYAEAVMNMTPYTALAVATIATTGYVVTKRREHKLAHVTVDATTHGGTG